jgi:hypothetical protein
MSIGRLERSDSLSLREPLFAGAQADRVDHGKGAPLHNVALRQNVE